MKIWHFLLPFMLASTLSINCVGRIYYLHSTGEKTKFSRLVYYPSQLVKACALEFRGVVADYLMLNSMVWHGEKLMSRIEVKPDEWKSTYRGLQLITDLDPRFMDPYLFAETSLTWDAGMIQETNQLLLKATKALPDNYRPYFFLWFNHYYFLQDPKTAGNYLEKASVIPGAPFYYKTLAARMHLQSGDIQSGIIFLQEMLHDVIDTRTRVSLQKRLDSLKIIAILEGALSEYVNRFGKRPEELSDLVSAELIKEIPRDPYGGEFYIMENGRVYTTSKLSVVEMIQQDEEVKKMQPSDK